jgi:DNA polymerase IIIc chi subunit
MRSMFPGQFRPTDDALMALWSDCVFVVDANVLLNLYRYSTETRRELERALSSVKEQLFVPHQAAKEFLKNRLAVTASQAEEYTKAIRTIIDLTSVLSNKKKHPFLPETELPKFTEQVNKLIEQLQAQQTTLLNRLTNDEILEFVQSMFEKKTGAPFDDAALAAIASEGDKRYQEEIPPGYKDGKKDASGDPYRKYGDLIVWKQLINKAKAESKPVIFVTDDKKEDWWLEQSGRTIGPRTELREEFISEVSKDFWMYTVDKFIQEVARSSNTKVSAKVIEEILEVRKEVKAERIADNDRLHPFKTISRQDMLDRLESSERWATENSEGFLGLVSYVKNYLGHAGYDYSASFDMIRQLQEEGLIEVYDHQGEGHERSVRAIRLVRPNKYANRPLEGLGQLIKETARSAREQLGENI